MNLFLPERSVVDSINCLDDRRLIKQILETAVLMDDKNGYKNHPVKVFYSDDRRFLAHYGYYCCCEYFHRFEKLHKCYTIFEKYIQSTGGLDISLIWWKRGLYASGSKSSPDCIRETNPEKVRLLFRQKLRDKWKNDKLPPKWTNSKPPKWYIEEDI